MSDEKELTEVESPESDGDDTLVAADELVVEAAPVVVREPMPPIENRFLYVDVAAQRAKQLRRGAIVRLDGLAPDPETGVRPDLPHKLERIAMQEVDSGLIAYEFPVAKPPGSEGS